MMPEQDGAITISVAEAVRAALTYHPDVIKKQLDVESAGIEITRQRAAFRPLLTTTASHRRESSYVVNTATSATGSNTSRVTSVDTALAGRTPLGTTYSLNMRGTHVGGFDLFLPTLIPQYQTQVSGRITQPLRRDAGLTANRGLVDRAELATESTRAQYHQVRLELALQVVAAYWTLVVRREEVHIREANASEARNLRELVERRIRGGQAPKSDVVQADVTVAEREQAVQSARLAVVNAERDLLAVTYLNRAGKFDWQNVLVPAERPSVTPALPVFDKELAIALSHRPELRRVERELALARLNHAIADNGKRMRFDVYVEAGVLGVAGSSTSPPGDPGEPPALIRGGLGKAFGNMVAAEAPFVEVGLQLEIPLGNGDRAGAAAQAKLRVEQVRAEDVRTAVTLDVRAAMQTLQIARSRLQGATRGEKLAGENVEAQRKRYEGGASTIFDTLRAQDELARAKAETLLAAAQQEVAVVQLMAARGTLIEHFGLEREGVD